MQTPPAPPAHVALDMMRSRISIKNASPPLSLSLSFIVPLFHPPPPFCLQPQNRTEREAQKYASLFNPPCNLLQSPPPPTSPVPPTLTFSILPLLASSSSLLHAYSIVSGDVQSTIVTNSSTRELFSLTLLYWSFYLLYLFLSLPLIFFPYFIAFSDVAHYSYFTYLPTLNTSFENHIAQRNFIQKKWYCLRFLLLIFKTFLKVKTAIIIFHIFFSSFPILLFCLLFQF